MGGGPLFLVLIFCGVAAVAFFGWASRLHLVADRKVVDLDELYIFVSSKVDIKVFRAVMRGVGESYSINPELIRPEDPLSRFIKADSWLLGAGTERLNDWLSDNGLDAHLASSLTVLELAQALEDSRRSSN